MIRFLGVSKYFNEFALKDITFSVDKGEFAYITGPSGAGKTTLLRLIYRAEHPDKGSVRVAGCDVGKLREGAVPFLRRQIGIVFQDFRLLQNKTVFDNIALALRIQGFHPKEIKDGVTEVLKDLGLRHKTNDLPSSLSGGQQQMIAIARAMVLKPALLLADEPTGNLDPDTSATIMRLFREINVRGTTVLVATHHREFFEHSGRRVIHLKDGVIEKETVG